MNQQQVDACSGTALLYMGPDGADDEWTRRLVLAMEADDVHEAEYVTAVMLGVLFGRSCSQAPFASGEWRKAFGGTAERANALRLIGFMVANMLGAPAWAKGWPERLAKLRDPTRNLSSGQWGRVCDILTHEINTWAFFCDLASRNEMERWADD